MKNFENKKITMSFNMKMFLVFVFVCAAMLAFFSPAYSVYLGGKQIAVVHSGETFEKIFEKANVLKCSGNTELCNLIRTQLVQSLSFKFYCAITRRIDPGDHIEGSRLSGTVRSYNCDDFMRLHPDIQLIDSS